MKFLFCLPVAVPDIFVGFQKPSSSVDRGHSLRSLDSATGGAPIAPQFHHIRIYEVFTTALFYHGEVSLSTENRFGFFCFFP
ncbi:MAG: hypothetical protein IKY18_03790 [Oscillospiraceae bacterium]|nr:hypothetical protein [Oscillospiraceae bacterium]